MFKKSAIIGVMLISFFLIGSVMIQSAFASDHTPVSHDLQISCLYVIDFRLIDVVPDRVQFFKNQKVVYVRKKTDFNETLWVNFKMQMDKNWSTYARMDQNFALHPNIFTTDQSTYVKGGEKSVGYLDQYGLTYGNRGMIGKIGRQDFKLGPLGMLADTTLTIGDTNVNGVSMSIKQDKMTWNGLYISQIDNNTKKNYNNKIWSLGTSYAADKRFTVGAYYATKINANTALNLGSKSASYREVNFNYKNIVPNVSFTSEFAWTKNDPFVISSFPASTIKSYVYQLAYQMDRKNVLKVGTVSIPFLSGISTLDPKANFINVQHSINKNEMVEVYYRDGKYHLPTDLYRIYGAGPYSERFSRITYWHRF